MADPLMAGIRFALYADLMLAMGLAGFLLYGLRSGERATPSIVSDFRKSLFLLCAFSLPLSLAWMLALAAGMFGVAIISLDTSMLTPIVLETSVGTAWLVQVAALAASTCAAVLQGRQLTRTATIITASGSVALATLAWSGHAAVGEGVIGSLSRAGDVIHMITAGLWLGAIAAFILLFRSPHTEARSIAARELSRFALTGSALVATIAVTGFVNVTIIARIGDPLRWPPGNYGVLLVTKLGLFAAMLALAALNRWKFTPRAQGVKGDGNAMRRSLAIELVVGISILLVVAVLGLLEP